MVNLEVFSAHDGNFEPKGEAKMHMKRLWRTSNSPLLLNVLCKQKK